MVDSKPCRLILDEGGSEWQWKTLAYYDTTTTMAVKSFMVQAAGLWFLLISISNKSTHGLFFKIFYGNNKLVHLSLPTIYILA